MHKIRCLRFETITWPRPVQQKEGEDTCMRLALRDFRLQSPCCLVTKQGLWQAARALCILHLYRFAVPRLSVLDLNHQGREWVRNRCKYTNQTRTFVCTYVTLPVKKCISLSLATFCIWKLSDFSFAREDSRICEAVTWWTRTQGADNCFIEVFPLNMCDWQVYYSQRHTRAF